MYKILNSKIKKMFEEKDCDDSDDVLVLPFMPPTSSDVLTMYKIQHEYHIEYTMSCTGLRPCHILSFRCCTRSPTPDVPTISADDQVTSTSSAGCVYKKASTCTRRRQLYAMYHQNVLARSTGADIRASHVRRTKIPTAREDRLFAVGAFQAFI